jgi:hypothetical protein
VTEVFGPTVRDYLRKVLLVMDSAPAHPPNLMEELPDEFNFIMVHFLPPYTTSLLQPMDQQVIANKKNSGTVQEMFRRHFFQGCDSEGLLKESLQYSGCCFLKIVVV